MGLTAVDTIRVGVGTKNADIRAVGQGRLAHDPVSVGRAPGSAVQVEHAWMPRRLMTVQPDGGRWALVNGKRTRCRVTSPGVEVVLAPARRLVLDDGEWRIRWPELDNPVDIRVHLAVPDEDTGHWPALADTTDAQGHPRAHAMTLAAGDDLAEVLTPLRRHRLAVLFRHVLEDRTAPDPFFSPAVAEAGCSMQVLKNLAKDTKELLNRQRGLTLEGYDSLGYYLVHTTGVIRVEHLTRSADDELPR